MTTACSTTGARNTRACCYRTSPRAAPPGTKCSFRMASTQTDRSAIWNVASSDHKLMQSAHHVAPGVNGCTRHTLPARQPWTLR
jgi:hypothetical protein